MIYVFFPSNRYFYPWTSTSVTPSVPADSIFNHRRETSSPSFCGDKPSLSTHSHIFEKHESHSKNRTQRLPRGFIRAKIKAALYITTTFSHVFGVRVALENHNAKDCGDASYRQKERGASRHGNGKQRASEIRDTEPSEDVSVPAYSNRNAKARGGNRHANSSWAHVLYCCSHIHSSPKN